MIAAREWRRRVTRREERKRKSRAFSVRSRGLEFLDDTGWLSAAIINYDLLRSQRLRSTDYLAVMSARHNYIYIFLGNGIPAGFATEVPAIAAGTADFLGCRFRAWHRAAGNLQRVPRHPCFRWNKDDIETVTTLVHESIWTFIRENFYVYIVRVI